MTEKVASHSRVYIKDGTGREGRGEVLFDMIYLLRLFGFVHKIFG